MNDPGGGDVVEGAELLPVAIGNWGSIEYAVRSNGIALAHGWLADASKADKRKFDHLFRRIAAVGKIVNKQQFRMLRDGIWEFKRNANRILCFQHGNCWLLTHHYPKSGDKCPAEQIDLAIAIRAEHLGRIESGG